MLLTELKAFLTSRIDPYANSLDKDIALLRSRFIELGQRGLLAIKTAKKFNGYAADKALVHDYFATMASSSYALAFLVAQHESCASLLQKGQNMALAETALPQMTRGEFRAGVGIYHLRNHAQSALIKAEKVAGGYRIDGTLAWLSGFEIFDQLALGFVCNDEELVALVPFSAQKAQGGSIRIGNRQEITAISSTNTVSIAFDQWFIGDDQIIVHNPDHALSQRAELSITHATMLLGLFQAALTLALSSKLARGEDPVIMQQLEDLNKLHDVLNAEL